MTRIKNIKTLEGKRTLLNLKGEGEIDASGLLMLPALIDPHVHFRTPGLEHKEDWKTGSIAAISAGVTRVLDMPNTLPPCTTEEAFIAKKALIEAQLKAVGIPLRYGLYFGADSHTLDQMAKAKELGAVGLKIFMGCSTGGLVIDTDADLDRAFRLAKEAEMLVAVHAEDEAILKANKALYKDAKEVSFHSKIRSKEAAIAATEKALSYAAKYGTKLYLLHMSTKEELELVKQAKKSGVEVYAEVTTHHLFFTIEDYATWGTFVQMNPPIRTKEDQEALWEGLRDGSIDTLGTDHAPHTISEKKEPFGKAPSGIPGIETLLPLMLDAVSRKKLSLKRLVELTRTNIEKIFNFPPNEDVVLVDLEMERKVEDRFLHSKCGWSPYAGRNLRGWPVFTILEGKLYPSIPKRLEEKQKWNTSLSSSAGKRLAKRRESEKNICECHE